MAQFGLMIPHPRHNFNVIQTKFGITVLNIDSLEDGTGWKCSFYAINSSTKISI